MSVQDSDAVRLRRSRLWTLAGGVFAGAALAALSFALREAGHRSAQQPVAAIPKEISTRMIDAVTPGVDQEAPLPQLVEKVPTAVLRADSGVSTQSGKAGMIARAQASRGAEFKKDLDRQRNESRSLAGVAPVDFSALKIGERGLTPRKDLVAVDAVRLPPGVPVIAQLGSRVLVPAEKLPEGVEPVGRSIVQEAGSQRLGILTGVILVQLKDWESRTEVASTHGLEIQLEKPRIRYLFATLRSPVGEPETAISQALAGLQQDPKVDRAEPEVLFRPSEAK